MAYSQGFHPHPKVSWVGAAPTGCASEAEYVELQLVDLVDPEAVRRELDAALPEGLTVLQAVLAGPGNLPQRIEASQWRIELPGIPVEQLRAAVRVLLATPRVQVERMTKDGVRMVDARAAVVSAKASAGPTASPRTVDAVGCGILNVVVRQVSPAVRPDDVLSALGVVAGLRLPVPAKATRMAQGRLDDDGGLVDPLDRDRELTGSGPDRSGDDVSRSQRDDVAGHAGHPPGAGSRSATGLPAPDAVSEDVLGR